MSAKLNLLADENMPAVEAMFGDFAQVSRFQGRSLTSADLRGVDLLLVRSITKVDSALLAEADQLKFVGTATIGTDHIDQALLSERNIAFASAPGCNADAVVDYVLSAIWNHCADAGRDPQGLTFGIIGCGNVGGRLANRLGRLGVDLLCSDPPRAKRDADFVDTPLDQLLAKSDVICCHTPLETGEHGTRHLLNSENLSSLKPEALLLNAGRGPVIDNRALLALLNARPDIHVVLDVWEEEPEVDLSLMSRAYIATPHIAGYSLDGKIRGSWMLREAVDRLMNLNLEGGLEAYLPVAPVRGLAASPGFRALDAMRLVYDQWRDDRAMRKSLIQSNLHRAASFDQLRKRYPVRREFSTLRLSGLKDQALTELRALGFSVEEV